VTGIGRAGRAIAVGLVLVAVTAVGGCTSDAGTTARHARAFRPGPEVAPIERLGRWDGRSFTPVAAGSVPGRHVYVLVHGWEPGFRAAVQRFPGPGPLLLWSGDAVDAHGERAGANISALAGALAAADPGAVVLAYSWIDDSATGPDPLEAGRVAARTDLNGQRLAVALAQAEAPSFTTGGGQVHLIGHSFGAKVATVAALGLDPAPAQLTLLDSPENAIPTAGGFRNHLEGYLPLLGIGRGAAATFVDSFFSEFGAPYHAFPGLGAVVDVHLLPAQYPLGDVRDRHAYPIRWYAVSAGDRAASVGLWWSPLLGASRSLGAFYEQDWARRSGVDRARELDLRLTAPRSFEDAIERVPVQVVPLHVGSTAGAPTDGVALAESGPRLWQVELTTGPGDVALSFDYRFTRPGRGDELAVWIDDDERFASVGAWAGSSGRRALVDVSGLESGRHTLTAVLAPAGERDARVVLGGLRMERLASSPARRHLSSGARAGLTLLVIAVALLTVVGLLGFALRRPGPRAEAERSAP
jgi:hypothetical protein